MMCTYEIFIGQTPFKSVQEKYMVQVICLQSFTKFSFIPSPSKRSFSFLVNPVSKKSPLAKGKMERSLIFKYHNQGMWQDLLMKNNNQLDLRTVHSIIAAPNFSRQAPSTKTKIMLCKWIFTKDNHVEYMARKTLLTTTIVASVIDLDDSRRQLNQVLVTKLPQQPTSSIYVVMHFALHRNKMLGDLLTNKAWTICRRSF